MLLSKVIASPILSVSTKSTGATIPSPIQVTANPKRLWLWVGESSIRWTKCLRVHCLFKRVPLQPEHCVQPESKVFIIGHNGVYNRPDTWV